jgi:hypothetical protein
MTNGTFGGFDGEDDLDDDLDDDFEVLGFGDVADAIGLPDELPALRLSAEPELAEEARSSALAARLAALADWVGADGRATDGEGDLSGADAAEGARALGVDEGEFVFLWNYALTGDWTGFGQDPELGPDDEPSEGTAHVTRSETAEAWSSGADSSVLEAWRTTLVSVLGSTFDVLLDRADEPTTYMELDGQGIAMAIMLFLSRVEGIALTDISETMLDAATATLDDENATRAKNAWLTAYGDPARLIITMLTSLGAVILPTADDGTVRLTPLGLWAVREELTDIGIVVPLLPANVTDMTAEELLLMADDTDQDEFESESAAWVAARDPEQAARELLRTAGSDDPDTRLLAVSVVTRIGKAAEPAWQASLGVPELRPYAKLALAGLEEETPGTVPDDREPLPEDLAWIATDMLVLACDDENPDPEAVAECLAECASAGEEATLFDTIASGAHPDADYVLRHIGHHHPDQRIAEDARTAADSAFLGWSRSAAAPLPG